MTAIAGRLVAGRLISSLFDTSQATGRPATSRDPGTPGDQSLSDRGTHWVWPFRDQDHRTPLNPTLLSQQLFSLYFQIGLTKCADTFIGVVGSKKGISGGERKRLAFASEVSIEPLVLIKGTTMHHDGDIGQLSKT